MDFPAELIPGGLLWPANALFLVVLFVAVQRAPLSRLLENSFSHLYFAACVVLLLLMMAPLDKAQYAVPYQAQKQELGGYR